MSGLPPSSKRLGAGIAALHQRDRDEADARCTWPTDNHDPGDEERR